LRLRPLSILALLVLALTCATASRPALAAGCSGDACTILSPFDGLRADLATNAPPRLVRLFTAEASLSQAWHPPGPCTPGSCVASQVVLIALDLQIRGIPTESCPGGCGFTATNAYVLDHEIRGILADPAIYAVGLQLLPPGPPCAPPAVPGPS
jgi:hypothetical protein